MVGATLSVMLTVCAADPGSGSPVPSVYRQTSGYAEVIRAQDPGPGSDATLSGQPDSTVTLPPGTIAPGTAQPGGVYLQDPFLGGQPVPQQPGLQYNETQPGMVFGAVGPQPYRFGWSTRFDVAWLAPEGTSDGKGEFEVFETNLAAQYTAAIPEGFPDVILKWTPEYNLRLWEGPQFVPLPGNVHRFASDIELSTPANAPASFQLGFTPALVTDFDSGIGSGAFNWDARGIMFFKVDPTLTVGIGTQYLDRVDDRFIPYGGIIWTPNDRWEYRLMFPKSRISYLLGGENGFATWAYGSFEYNIEAYEIGMRGLDGGPEKIQIQDYRALFGLRTDDGNVAAFIEAGYVFSREVDFARGTPGFTISPGFITRAGLRF